MNSLTRVLLVLLRLAIGWQILVEGVDKLGDVDQIGPVQLGKYSLHFGPAKDKRPWSSETYLREANGPYVGDFFRHYVLGDMRRGGPEDVLIQYFKVQDGTFPPLLEEEWDYYLKRFCEHYGLNEMQRNRAEAILAQQKQKTLRWLQENQKRLADFEAKRKEVLDLQQAQREMGLDVARDKLVKAKGEYRQLGRDLQADLDRQTQTMRDTLTGDLEGKEAAAPEALLTREQHALGPVPPPLRPREGDWLDWAIASRVGLQDRTVAQPRALISVEHIDGITKWGLTVIGLCLLLGLFSRTACVGGFCFLLLFYLAMPPFPWLPVPPNVEGHYLYVNKTLIEAIALLMLATTRSGKWFGLDGLLQFLNPWRRRRRRMTLQSIASRPATGDVVTVSRSGRVMKR
jgi:uncharacterized membrane protein YphA (DoxX/SURF4 family)